MRNCDLLSARRVSRPPCTLRRPQVARLVFSRAGAGRVRITRPSRALHRALQELVHAFVEAKRRRHSYHLSRSTTTRAAD